MFAKDSADNLIWLQERIQECVYKQSTLYTIKLKYTIYMKLQPLNKIQTFLPGLAGMVGIPIWKLQVILILGNQPLFAICGKYWDCFYIRQKD
jgi:hypothetical protein